MSSEHHLRVPFFSIFLIAGVIYQDSEGIDNKNCWSIICFNWFLAFLAKLSSISFLSEERRTQKTLRIVIEKKRG